MGANAHRNVSASIHLPIRCVWWVRPWLLRSRLPIRPIWHDCRRDPEGPGGRREGLQRCRNQAQGVHGGGEEEVRGLCVCPKEGCRGCHHKGEGARREAWTIRLWPIWPNRRFRWIRLRLRLSWLLWCAPIWLWSIWPPILLDECSPAMRCVEHNVMLRSARSMELSREEPLAFLMINAQRCPKKKKS